MTLPQITPAATPAQWEAAILAILAAHFTQSDITINIQAGALASTETLTTPALLLEWEDGRMGAADGHGGHQVIYRLTLHCVLSQATPQVGSEIRLMATQVLTLVNQSQQWRCQNVGLPERLEMGPGKMQAGEQGYDSWYVTWEQSITLGDAIWTNTDGRLRAVEVSLAPQA